MDPMTLEFLIKIGQILIAPVTVVILAIILRPFLKALFVRIQTPPFTVTLHKQTLEKAGEKQDFESISDITQRRIAEGLEEESKDKLEKLRLALETEQVNQIIQYHQNSLAQSQISFWFSIGAGTLGFLVIVLGTVMALVGVQSVTAVLTVCSGGIIDAVAALFFTQSNQARKLMTEFFDKLRKDRQFNESLRLCESISDGATQCQLKAQLSLFFAGVPADTVRTLDEKPK